MVLLVLVRGVYKPPKLKHFGPRLCPPGPRMASHMVAQMTSNSSVLCAQCAVIQSPCADRWEKLLDYPFQDYKDHENENLTIPAIAPWPHP